eukprot:4813246-Prymnesium_polylepis.1
MARIAPDTAPGRIIGHRPPQAIKLSQQSAQRTVLARVVIVDAIAPLRCRESLESCHAEGRWLVDLSHL